MLEIWCYFDSRSNMVYATPWTSITEVRYLALQLTHLYNNRIGRHFIGKVVNNEVTQNYGITFYLLSTITSFLQISSNTLFLCVLTGKITSVFTSHKWTLQIIFHKSADWDIRLTGCNTVSSTNSLVTLFLKKSQLN